MKKFVVVLVALMALLVAGCGNGVSKGQQQENKQQAQDTTNLVVNQPIPATSYSQMRQTLIEIERAQIAGSQTTSFFFNQGVQDPVKVCPSIGTPIPNTASLSNPSQVLKDNTVLNNGGGNVVVDQMDPNGVYVPQASTGTYVLCVDPSGKPYVSYWEGFVQTEYAPAVWDYTHHQIKDIGAPTATFTKTR